MNLNCAELVPIWSEQELDLIFELLGDHHYEPHYNMIGRERDLSRLCFVNVWTIRELLSAMIGFKLARKATLRNSARVPFVWATEEEIRICNKLRHEINMHIIKTWFRRLVGIR